MSFIRIITSKVQQTAFKIDAVGLSIRATGKLLSLLGLSARTYENNSFGPKIKEICREADARAIPLANMLGTFSVVLTKRVAAFQTADNSFISRIVNWIHGLLFPPSEPDSVFGDINRRIEEERKTAEQEKPTEIDQESVLEPHTEELKYVTSYSPTGGTPDCVDYVSQNRENGIPSNAFNKNVFYSGNYRGGEGEYNGYEYGQVPQVGAISVETSSGSSGAGVTYGHASYVYEVTYDETGFPESYKVANSNWGNSDAERAKVKTVEFAWDAEKGAYYGGNGDNRSPDCFIY